MTAIRVVSDHQELDNSGTVTHATLDSYVNSSPFAVVSGAAGPVTPSARKIKAGANITITDGGPGGDLIISSPTSTTLSGTVVSWMEVPSGSNNGVNLDFTLLNSPSPPSALMFFINGVLQKQGTGNDYTLSGPSIHILDNYRSGSALEATYPYVPATGSIQITWMEVPSGLVNGANTSYTLAFTPSPSSALMFFINGVLQVQGAGNDYTLAGGTISVSYPPRAGSNIAATYPH